MVFNAPNSFKSLTPRAHEGDACKEYEGKPLLSALVVAMFRIGSYMCLYNIESGTEHRYSESFSWQSSATLGHASVSKAHHYYHYISASPHVAHMREEHKPGTTI